MRLLSHVVNQVVPPSLRRPGDHGDGFPAYLHASKKAGMDVNDWIESELGWVSALPVLEDLVFPFLRPASSVCEVGVGTGRWARHLAARVPDGRLLLVDNSAWIVDFLRGYFASERQVRAVRCDGSTIPAGETEWADLVFSQGMFITLKLGHILLYLREFAKHLKPSGVCVFDFIDPDTERGWAFLEREAPRAHDVFAYHTMGSIAKCCAAAGLDVVDTRIVGKSTFIVARRS